MSNEKTILALKKEKSKYEIQLLLEKEYITESDLIKIMGQSTKYGLIQNNEINSQKQNILRTIFNSPFILYD